MAGRSREWTSYLPDGRPVVVRHEGGRWVVSCEGESAEDDELVPALASATGLEPQDGRVRRADAPALRDWIELQATRIEEERAG